MAKNDFNMAAFRHLELKIMFGHVTVIDFAVVYQVSSKSNDFSSRYGDFTIFKKAGSPPSWILGVQ